MKATSLAYINLDPDCVQGIGGLQVSASPMIKSVFHKAASYIKWPKTPNQNVQEIMDGIQTEGV